MWVEPEIRDSVVKQVTYLSFRSGIPVRKLLAHIGLRRVKFYKWMKRAGTANHHNGKIPKTHWLTPDEVKAIEDFAREHYLITIIFLKTAIAELPIKCST